MTKKIYFVETAGSIANIFENQMKLPLLGSLYLGTILHNAGYEVQILNENILKKKIHPIELDADYVCLSCLTLSASRTIELARGVRRMYPRTKLIVGGIHPSLLPEEFISTADHIVIGEAEEIILDIIEGKYTDQIIYGRPVKNLDELPLINYRLLKRSKRMNIIPVMTSRGCPFNCNFCTVTTVFGKAFRQQSIDRIIREIKHAVQYFNRTSIFFYDDNFTTNKRFSNELFDRFIKEKLNISWTAQVRADIVRDAEVLGKMFKAGCDRVFIGFESVDERVLKAYGKSQTRADIEKAIHKIHAQGINIHGMFMFGEDNDTLESIDHTVDFAITNYIDTVQFMALTPFPGTQIYEKINSEKRLLHTNWDYFNGMHVVHKPMKISPLELQEGLVNAHKKFYSFSRTMLDLLYFAFNITFDAFVWNFKHVRRYDINNLYLKAGAKFIISVYIKFHRNYISYLQNSVSQ
ncbi:MAG: radical SAM protein [bacterium]